MKMMILFTFRDKRKISELFSKKLYKVNIKIENSMKNGETVGFYILPARSVGFFDLESSTRSPNNLSSGFLFTGFIIGC